MKRISIITLCLIFSAGLIAQKYYTKEGEITFFSDAPMEKIEAHNNRVTAIMDTETGRLEFAALIKAFQFDKALMQEHFNENYMESSTYPKAVFKGHIEDPGQVDFSENGRYDVNITGELTIHGVTREIKVPAQLEVASGTIEGATSFVVKCADYDIKIPSVVAENIAKEIEVDVAVSLKPFNQ